MTAATLRRLIEDALLRGTVIHITEDVAGVILALTNVYEKAAEFERSGQGPFSAMELVEAVRFFRDRKVLS